MIQLSDGRIITPFDPKFSAPQGSIPGGGSGDMAVAIPAAISAAGAVGSAVAGGKGAKDAAKIQAQSYDKGLAFEREKEAERRAQFARAFEIWFTSQNALRERYGLPPLPGEMRAFPGVAAGAPAEPTLPGGGVKPGVGGAPPPEPTLTARSGRPVTAAEGGPMPGATIGQMIAPRDAEADLGRWNDWQRYELA